MPIYEYQCSKCQHQFELIQKMAELPVKKCPECLEDTATRLISPAGFQLKGTGWYVTDFKNKDKGKPADKRSSVEKSSTSATSKKGETD